MSMINIDLYEFFSFVFVVLKIVISCPNVADLFVCVILKIFVLYRNIADLFDTCIYSYCRHFRAAFMRYQ